MFYGVVADRIIASFKPLHVVTGLIVCSGRVVYSGDQGVVEKAVKLLGGELIDYGKHTVMPGFIDPHLHLDGLALEDYVIDLRNTGSLKEIYGLVERFIKEKPWVRAVIGRGWDQGKLAEKKYPDKNMLDKISRDKPIVLIRVCGHIAVANTKALELLGVGEEKVDWVKGVVLEDKVRELVEALGVDKKILESMARKQVELASKGITSIGWVSSRIQHLGVKRVIDIRYYLEPRDFTRIQSLPRETLACVDGVKIVLDGSLGAHTAYLSKPYTDKPDTTGLINYSIGELEKIIGKALEKNYKVAVHAIGDKALDTIITVYSRLGGVKQRIEHASIIRDDQVKLLKKLDARIVVQPGFILSDTWILERVGVERIKWVYRIKTLVENNIVVGFSSDAPVEPPNPWRNIYAAVTRGENEGLDIAYYTRHEKIDVLTALHLHTHGSAQTLYQEDLGKLEPGYRADYIVVDTNPIEVEPKELLKIRTIETRVSGTRVYPR